VWIACKKIKKVGAEGTYMPRVWAPTLSYLYLVPAVAHVDGDHAGEAAEEMTPLKCRRKCWHGFIGFQGH
jgi:hypothetical protein